MGLIDDGQHRGAPAQPEPGKPSACAICAQVVDQVWDADTGRLVGYRHTAVNREMDADHLVVAVSVSAIRTNFLCDFCLVDGARWELPVEDYSVSATMNDVDGWAACDDCADALRRDDWHELVSRTRRANWARGTFAPRAAYVRMFDELRPHITGPVRLHV